MLDGSKTGATVTSAQQVKDRNMDAHMRGGGLRPQWKGTIDSSGSGSWDQLVTRPQNLPKFVMDEVWESLRLVGLRLDRVISERLGDHSRVVRPDPHLTRPWESFAERAQQVREKGHTRMTEAMDLIKREVEMVYNGAFDAQRNAVRENTTLPKPKSRRPAFGKSRTPSFTDLPIEKRQDILRKQSQRFQSVLVTLKEAGYVEWSDTEILQCMASYLYLYDSKVAKGGWSRMPWNLALRILCCIKANAVSDGRYKTLLEDFYNNFVISRLALDWIR